MAASRGSFWKMSLAVVAVAAAAGAGYTVLAKKKAARNSASDWVSEASRGSAVPATTSPESGSSALENQLASEVDVVADTISTDIVDAIEEPPPGVVESL